MVGPPWFRRLHWAYRWYCSGQMMVSESDIRYLCSKLDAKNALLHQLIAELEAAPAFKFIQLRLKNALEL